MMNMEQFRALAGILAGLGLFFVGIKLMSENMQQLASLRLRRLISQATARPILASLLGVAGGFLMQKPSGVIAILASMQASGMITLRQAMPIIAWCNVGLALLAFYVVIPIDVFVAYVMGITGFVLMFSRNKQRISLLNAIFGAAMLFFGLELMKTGTGVMGEYAWFRTAVGYSNASPLIALVVGAFMAAITQSFMAIAMMAVGLVTTGALGEANAMMVIYGANFGVGFFRRLMTTSLTGEGKQLFIYQNFFRYVGTFGSVLLFYIPVHGMPVLLFLAKQVSPAVDTELALVFLVCNLPAVLVSSLFQERFARWIEARSPATADDDLARLKFLINARLEDRGDTLNRLAAELTARVEKLAGYMDAARAEKHQEATADAIHWAGEVIYQQIDTFEQAFMRQTLSPHENSRLSTILNIQALVCILDDALYQLSGVIRDKVGTAPGSLKSLSTPILEAMDTFVPALARAMASGDSNDVEMLMAMTHDKWALMDQVRRQYLAGETGADPLGQAILLELTNSFEHATWLIHRLSKLLARQDEGAFCQASASMDSSV